MKRLLAAIGLAVTIPAIAVGQTRPDAPASAPPEATPDRPQPIQLVRDDKAMRRQLYEALTCTTVSIDLRDVPSREAFRQLARMLPMPLVGRYQDDALGYGIDPELTITLTATGRPALEVLESMLEQCGRLGSPCTWQIRLGFVEFGTKTRLSVPAARETRLYYIADLINDMAENPLMRTRREYLGIELVQDICERVEPGRWDYGQPPGPDDEELLLAPPPRRPDTSAAPDAAATPATAPSAEPRPEPKVQVYVSPTRTAIIRYWRDALIVNAPDYVHRQIDGYPKPVAADVQR